MKSAGLDGVKGTFDDGLPRTYDEFYKLCDYISLDCVPITWGGTCYPSYFNRFLESLAADYEGLEQATLNYTLSGTAKTLARLDANGELVFDTEKTTITESNFGELSRQAGKYYALKFVEKIATTEAWQHSKVFNTGYEHLDAQDSFLRGRFSDDAALPTVAMLMDGVWWEMEAEDTFKYMESEIGESVSKKSRRFGIMPFPKATEEKAELAKQTGIVQTYADLNKSFAYMKSNVAADKKALAKEFIMFCCSDEMLEDFTLTTDTFKALDYQISNMDALSAYGKSLAQLREKSEIVYPYSGAAKFINNESYFDVMSKWSSKFNDLTYNSAVSAIKNSRLTAEELFTGLKSYADTAIRGLK